MKRFQGFWELGARSEHQQREPSKAMSSTAMFDLPPRPRPARRFPAPPTGRPTANAPKVDARLRPSPWPWRPHPPP
ncbi:MAG: hypothetical protein ACK5CQ_12260, partial [Cyanobacteriota bacterium]